MANVTRKIGLSLGADLCWPICYEDILSRLDLALPIAGDTVRFQVERVTIEPFDLAKPKRYDLVIDRLTHWYDTSREWIKKSILLDDVYVYNNPWSVQSMEKQTTYCAMMRLGLPIPKTWLLPPKEYEDLPDLKPTLQRYAQLFDLPAIGRELGYPLFMKPYDGGGWVGVSKINNADELLARYDESGKFVMHLQQGVHPYDMFVRSIGLGPQVKTVRYEPDLPLHLRYQEDVDFLPAADERWLADVTLVINAFFGWDFNSCESLRKQGTWHPIDFANPCPDSQVTSLHFHFPWLVKANLRWSLFCAATRRPVCSTLSWKPYFEIADEPGSALPEKLARYAELARAHFDVPRFEEFCAEHLAHLDEVAWEYFETAAAKRAVQRKVEALFPEHEWNEFSEHFWDRIQAWRRFDAGGRDAVRSALGKEQAR